MSYRNDRSKYFLANHFHVWFYVNHHRWSKQCSFKSASCKDTCTLLHGFLNFQVYLFCLFLVDHGTDIRRKFPGVTNPQRLYR